MHRMPPTTKRLSQIFLGETIVWILADEKERKKEQNARQPLRTHACPETCYGLISNIPRRPIPTNCFPRLVLSLIRELARPMIRPA
jgi:hypothetical protein